MADEVRKLAERTKMSTEDIATMIEAIRSGTMKAVESMTHGTVMANEGMALVGRTGDSMVTIHGSTDKVLAAIDDVRPHCESKAVRAMRSQRALRASR